MKRVLAWGSDNCALGGDEVITDGLGMVHFPSRYEFRGLVILYGDPIDPMVLCVYRNAELVGAAEFTLMGGAPERMEVECDLDLLAALGQSRFCGSPSWIDEKRREMATARHSS